MSQNRAKPRSTANTLPRTTTRTTTTSKQTKGTPPTTVSTSSSMTSSVTTFAYNSAAEKWLHRTCCRLRNEEWPESVQVYFDGSSFEASFRLDAICLLLNALSRNVSAKTLSIRNLAFTQTSRDLLERCLVQHPNINVLNLANVSYEEAVDADNDNDDDHCNNKLFSSERMLERLQSFEELEIDNLQSSSTNTTNIMSASALSKLLQNSSTIRTMKFANIHIGQDIDQIVDTLSYQANNLTTLCWSGAQFGQQNMCMLLEGMSHNTNITSLRLGKNRIGRPLASELAAMISNNRTIQTLDLQDNDICKDTIAVITKEGLSRNSTIQHLILSRNPIGDLGIEVMTDWMSSSSCRLQSLYLDDCEIWCEGGKYLAQGLAKVRTLSLLAVDGDELDVNLLDLRNSLEHSNTSLRHIITRTLPYGIRSHSEDWQFIEFCLQLNAAQRRMLMDPSVPESLWPHMLQLSSKEPQLLYYMIRNNSSLLANLSN